MTATTPTSPVPAGTPVYRDHGRPLWRRLLVSREAAIAALLAIVIIVGYTQVPYFASDITVTYLVLDMAPVLLIALPMTLVIITGEIDLSVASVMGLTSALLGLLTQAGWDFGAAALLALVVGLLCGAVNGFLVTVVGLPSLAVTIGSLALFRGVAQGLLGTTAVTDFPSGWTSLANLKIPGTPLPLVSVLIIVLAIVFGVVLHLTPFGRGVYAIGLSPDAAAFSGVRIGRTKFLLFLGTALVASLAGIYYTLRFGSARGDNATGQELSVIAAVLLGGVSIFGGVGSILGPLLGTLLIGTLASALRLAGITSNIINVVTGTLLIAAVVGASFLARLQTRRAGGRKKRIAGTPQG